MLATRRRRQCWNSATIQSLMSKPITRPYASRDTEHVPPPDPANFWEFAPGEERTIGTFQNGTVLAFRVHRIHYNRVEGTETLGRQKIVGYLWMDMPVVIVRDRATREPQATL